MKYMKKNTPEAPELIEITEEQRDDVMAYIEQSTIPADYKILIRKSFEVSMFMPALLLEAKLSLHREPLFLEKAIRIG
jgi:hypothetical protein